jgi:hypothetical protein
MTDRRLETAELLAVGAELLVGDTRDTNSGDLAVELTAVERFDGTRGDEASKARARAAHRGGHPGVLAADHEHGGATYLERAERVLGACVEAEDGDTGLRSLGEGGGQRRHAA